MTNLRTCALDLETAASNIEDDPVPASTRQIAERDRIVRAVRDLAARLRALDKQIWRS